MRFRQWRICFNFLPLIDTSDKWLYHFNLNFVVFVIAITDLGGKITICNCQLIWEKMFWRSK